MIFSVNLEVRALLYRVLYVSLGTALVVVIALLFWGGGSATSTSVAQSSRSGASSCDNVKIVKTARLGPLLAGKWQSGTISSAGELNQYETNFEKGDIILVEMDYASLNNE